jgi:deazaflavin-dependent oxidoreductase (nitroreductase family)
MAKEIQPRSRPRGLARLLLRAPVWLYRLGLGWLLGRRFLMIEHKGRVSGKPRYVVVEVVRHDRRADTYVIASGWGRQADWYRNVRVTPEVRVTAGARRMNARAVVLPQAEATRELCGYAQAHPAAFAALTRFMTGVRNVACEDLVEFVPVVVLVKRS